MSSHKINIDVALNGQQQAVSGIQAVINKAKEAGNVRVTKIYDAQGSVTGAQIAQSFKQIGTEAAKANPRANMLVDSLKRAAIVAPIWMIMRNAMMLVFKTFTDQVKFLVEFETAMTRIKIVGKGTADEYNILSGALVNLAHAYGTSSAEAATAAVLFAQQGRNVRDTITLTATAMLASKILGTDIKTAVDDMTAAVEGFQISVGDSTKIVDKWINVEKQFAVTSKDLADATKVSGASANQLGVTIDEFLGDVTAVVEVTRKSGAEAARGIAFIYARLLTTGRQTVQQIAQVPYYLDATGKATNEVSGRLRSQAAILEDLAGKWSGLDKEEKLSIAKALGSMRQMTVLNALMQNYNTSLDARIAGLTSAGAAEKAFGLIQDTTAYKVQQLGSAWNVFTAAVANTDSFKSSISALDQFILGVTSLINLKAGYAAIAAKEINVMQLSNETRLNEVKSYQELIDVRTKLEAAKPTEENTNRLKLVQDAINAINEKEPKIKVAFDTGTPEVLQSTIQKRLNTLEELKVRLSLETEFGPQIAAAQDYIEKARAGIATSSGKENVEWTKRLADEESKLAAIYVKNETAVKSTLAINKGLEASKKNILSNEEALEAEETAITQQESEKLDIAKQINLAKESGLLTEQELLKLEIDLIEQSRFQQSVRKDALKVKELESKMASAILKDSETLISHELEILKLRGASESQLFAVENALQMQLHGEDAIRNSLKYKLEMEKQLTKEKLNQVEISNDSLSIYKLAQKYGIDAAKEVNELITGQTTPRGFENRAGSSAKAGYAEFFSSRKEAEDAATYFGLEGGRGGYAEGSRIGIPEQNIGRARNLEELRQQYGVKPGESVATSRPVNIQSIQVNVTPEKGSEKTAEQLQIDIANAIRTDSKVRAALDEKIAEF